MGILKDVADVITKPIGLAIGAVQAGKANKLYKEAEKINPPMEDQRMTALLDSIKRKAAMADVSPLSVETQKAAAEGLVTTQSALTSSVKGDAGSLLSGLRKTQSDYIKGLSGASAVASQESKYYTSLVGQLTDKIAARKFDLTMYKKLQKLREASEMRKSANQNIAGGLAQIPDVVSGIENLLD